MESNRPLQEAIVASNPLADVIPAQARKYVYLVAAAALFVYSLWEASNGDIRTFVISLVSALVAGLAASNTSEVEPEEYDPEAHFDGH